MAFSDAHARGFALAAILHDERDLGWATARMDHNLLQSASAQVNEVRDAADKRQALAQLVRAVHGERDAARLPPHAAGWLTERTKAGATSELAEELVGVLSRLARYETSR